VLQFITYLKQIDYKLKSRKNQYQFYVRNKRTLQKVDSFYFEGRFFMSNIDMVADNKITNSEESIKNVFKEKLGEFISLDINKIQISEFNTRCQFLDNLHVKTLMDSIEKRGYIPKSAVWVNAVTDNGTKQGNIIQYRLVAGRHRYEACRRIELKEIPCQLYYNLTDEEECELDTIDNELDEHHKPINFLEVAEHYKYLRDVKGWSQRQIARAKNVSKGIVHYKWKISDLSEEVKAIIRSAHHGGQFVERYMRELLKLSSIPHQILICKEITGDNTDIDVGTSWNQFQKEEVQVKCTPQKPMTQSDVEARVAQLLALEQQEEIAEEALAFIKDESANFPDEQGNNLYNQVEKNGEIGQVFFEDYPGADIKVEDKNKNSKQYSSKNTSASNKPVQENQNVIELPAVISEERDTKGVRFGVTPLWIKHTGLIQEFSSGAYMLLLELIINDFRYNKGKKDSFFFIKHDDRYENCIDNLSYFAGVKPVTLVKKVLPELERFINYRKNEIMKFRIKWDKLYEVYKNNAHRIPFDDGGLRNIPQDYSGLVRPTPYHTIYIENGKIKNSAEEEQKVTISNDHSVKDIEITSEIDISKLQEIKKERIEQKAEEPVKEIFEFKSKQVSNVNKEKSNSPLAIFLRERGMAEEMINFCLVRHGDTENVIKLLKEMSPAEQEKIKNIPGYIYKLVRDGFTPPEGFETVQEVEERKERKRTTEEFGEKIRKEFEEGKIKYFSPKEDLKFPLSIIPNNIQFLYKRSNGIPLAGIFSEWMNEKFFTG